MFLFQYNLTGWRVYNFLIVFYDMKQSPFFIRLHIILFQKKCDFISCFVTLWYVTQQFKAKAEPVVVMMVVVVFCGISVGSGGIFMLMNDDSTPPEYFLSYLRLIII